MKIKNALQKGLAHVIDNYKAIAIIYGVNFFTALIVAVPFYRHLSAHLGHAGVRHDLMQGFNYDWWLTFKLNAQDLESTFRPSLSGGFGALFDNIELLLTGQIGNLGGFIITLAFAYLILAAFLNGGVIGLMADEKRTFSVSRFFSLSGFYFHHFFALALTNVLVSFLIYFGLRSLVFNMIDQITKTWLSAPAIWFVNLIGFLVILFVVIFVNMIFDYAKFHLVSEKKESSWLCIWLALKFIIRRIPMTGGLYMVLSLVSTVLLLVFGSLLELVEPRQFILILVAFLVQQLYITFKIGLRLLFYGSQFALYQAEKMSLPPKKRKV